MAYIGRQQSSGAFLKLDDLSSQFNNSTTNDKSSGVTITRGGSERFTPTVAGTSVSYTHLTLPTKA